MGSGRNRVRTAAAFAVAVAVAALGSVALPGAAPVATAAIGTSPPAAFEPVGPIRLADTRRPDCSCQRIDDRTIRVAIGGTTHVPEPVTAAAITVTVTRTTKDGFATVHPSGASRPNASTVNYLAGKDAANSAIVRVGADGAIDVYTSSAADVIVDLTGVFTGATESAAGRFVSMTPRRILDGREPGAPAGDMTPGAAVTIPMPGTVPADATAVAVNVTSLDARRAGYLVGSAAGDPPPETSFLNVDGSGIPIAAALILPVSASGITITNTAGGRLLVDLSGYFTGASAPTSSDGLFVATTPTRLLDTRGQTTRVWRNGTLELASPFGDASALVTNITTVITDGPGFVTAYPAGTDRPGVSALNAARRDHVIPNAAITPVSTRGVAYYSWMSTDLIVDLNGYFVGTPEPASQPVPPNTPVPKRVLMVGDSTLAAVRNVTASQALLVGFDPVLDALGCRRLVWPSCYSDSDFLVPNTVEEAILETPGVLDVVIVMAGYNDWFDPFGDFVDAIMDAARSKGARQVVWLTFADGRPGSHWQAILAYEQNTEDLWAAAPRHPDLAVADWRTYVGRSTGWREHDGVHLARRGAYGLADYMSRWMAHLDERPCTAPMTPGGAVQDPCPNPNTLSTVPDITGLYGV